MFFASTAFAAAGGNNGTVLINGQNAASPGNDPHLSCPIVINWSGFDVPVPPTPDNHYSVAFTGVQPTGGNILIDATRSDSPTGDFKTATLQKVYYLSLKDAQPNHKGEIHVNVNVTTTASHTTDTKSKTVWLQGCTVPPPATLKDLTISGICSPTVAGRILWTVVNPNTVDDATSVQVQSSPAGVTATPAFLGTISAGQSATFTTPAPFPSGTHMAATATVSTQTVHSTGGTFRTSTCAVQGQAENPASVSFSDDCTGITATFVSADQHTSTFTVTPPLGAPDTVTGSTSKHYVANASHKHIAITDDKGGTYSHDWVDPGTCNPGGGQAAPVVTEANHCTTGMNLTLSNMNGTAPATFTVVDPDGTVQTVSVNAGQLKKLVFAVKEDTTGTLSVTANGGSKQSFAYKKNCASVLGVKHIRKPSHNPQVLGEHQQLPFTGFDTKRALLDGSVVFFLGAVLCMLGARRREEEQLYY